MRPALYACAALAVCLAACSPKGGGEDVAAKLKAELPAPYSGGDTTAGKIVFIQCSACHTVNETGSNMVGPNLYGVFGSKAGTRKADFAYTDALKATGWTWDAAAMDRWLENPQGLVPGTKMVFPGVKAAKDRVDVIAYLKVASSGGPP